METHILMGDIKWLHGIAYKRDFKHPEESRKC